MLAQIGLVLFLFSPFIGLIGFVIYVLVDGIQFDREQRRAYNRIAER